MQNYKLLIRASSMSQFLTSGRAKDKVFGDTALNLIKKTAVADVFNLHKGFSSKETEKGDLMETKSIELYNLLYFTEYKKNAVRITENGFTGECDIDDPNNSLIIDIKNAWSADSFSWTADDLAQKAKKAGYDDQLRTYMMLYNRDNAQIAETLLSTPIDLIPSYEDVTYHEVDHIPANKRITIIDYKRDRDWEEMVQERYLQAEKIYNEFINQILNK